MKGKRALAAMSLTLLMLVALPFFGGVGASEQEMVLICHNPGVNQVTMEIPAAAVEAHAAHGDVIGSPCAGVYAQCTDKWTAEHTDMFAVYYLEVDRDALEGRSTYIWTPDRVERTLSVTVTSLSSGDVWRFARPSCGTECGYLLGWYGGTTHSIGEGTGTYEVQVRQAHEGLVRLYCAD